MLRPDDEAAVRVAVATLWSAPEAVRAVDAPTLAAPPDVPGWVAAMTPAQQVDSGVVSQLLLGERVVVREVRADGWARVVAVGQPAAGLDPRGYPGWLPVVQLGPAENTVPAERCIVRSDSTDLRGAPGGTVALPGVVLGTMLAPAGEPTGGWLPVQVDGLRKPLWATAGDLEPVPARAPTGAEVLATARRFLDIPYVWGGLSTAGIDCSGLVHLVWRRLGIRLPRDAHEQAAATTPVPPGDVRPGDLYFFAREGRRIHHVGIVAAAPAAGALGRMVHASSDAHRVLEEELRPDRAATFAGAHRVG
jgi:hypothetical protein